MDGSGSGGFGVRTVGAFEKLAQIGEGTYGEVFKARERDTGDVVALKKLRCLKDSDDFSRTTVRELKLLRTLFHENLVLLREVVAATVKDAVTDENDKPGSTYLVFEYLPYDLAGLIESGMDFTHDHIRWYALQLLRGIEYMHANDFVHRDLKSANLLLDDMHKLKLADFGLSRVLDNRKPDRTNKVITLWYRPPELLLGETRYGPAVDMWSIGCIIIELFRKRPLFAADTDAEMLERIFHVLGSPTASTWSGFHKLASKSGFSLAKSYDPTLDRVFASAGVPYHAQRLLKSLLSLDPELRPSASEALKSPFFTDVQHLSAELIAQRLGPISLHIDVTLDHHEFMARQRRRTRDSGPKLQPAKAEPAVVMPAPAPVPPPVVPEPTAPLLIPSGRVSSSGRVEYLLPPPVARPQSLFVIPEPVVKPFTLAPVAKLHKVDPHVEVAVAAKTDVKESPVVDRRRSRSRERSEKREHRRFSRSRSRDRRREDRPREHEGRHRERDREDRRDRHENRHREHRGREDRDDRERGRERERERDRRHHSYSDDRHRHRERGDRYRSRSPRR